MISDPSSNLMNFGKWVAVLSGEKDIRVIEEMSNRDMEEAKKEIDKITIEFDLEREKKINAEKELDRERQNLVEFQKKISSLEKQRVKTEHDIEVNEKSSDNFKKKSAIEKENLIKKLEKSEKLVNDMADMTQEKIMKADEKVDEAKRSEAELTDNLNRLRTRLAESETHKEKEMDTWVKERNKLLYEKNNAERHLESLKNASVSRNADYDREIQRLSERINELEQEKVSNLERIRVFSEQSEQEKAANIERNRVLREQLKRGDIGDNIRDNIEHEIEVNVERNNEIDTQVEREREEVEERNSEIDVELEGNPDRISLKEKIKNIFKKYGFTVTAVITAIGVVIGTIVSKLAAGLSKMEAGVGNGFKDIGKKLAQILPGMIGAIANFIFKTAGEVVGFLAENAWLLVVAVVFYFVESLKKKKNQ